MSLLAEVQFGREVSGDLEASEAREWLVTNGLGGFASGTVAGTATRRYHGLLIAALQPPTGRTLLVSGLDESVTYLGGRYSLSTNRWMSGFVSPSGYLQIENFFLEGTKPVWQFALADGLLEKRVWMKQGENTTYVQYILVRARGPVELDAKVLVGYRDFHATTHENGSIDGRVILGSSRATVTPYAGLPALHLAHDAQWTDPIGCWFRQFRYDRDEGDSPRAAGAGRTAGRA